LTVTATAYNSVEAQTKQGNPSIAAWGDTLKPGMKAIAVSRDLIDSGLTHNTEVKIEGFEGTYLVKDKMNKRWTNKIDIYMGLNEEKARNWGKQQVNIYVAVKQAEEN
jgi:3D (Asp-Asp-Asp) domain-containing protein